MKKNFIPSGALIIGMILILWSISLTGDVRNFVSLDGLVITVLGSFMALVIAFPIKVLKNIPNTLKILFITPEQNRYTYVELFSELAKKSRRDGLLSLEDRLEGMENEYLIIGLQMVMDGVEPEMIRNVLNLKIETMERRHSAGQEVFTRWAELAPAFGMVGTLIGLITMLAKLDDPSSIGAGMATALLTTFYGALMANLIFIPIASNLNEQSNSEIFTAEMIIDGVLEIQAGTNPRMIEEKLVTYLAPEELKQREKAMDSSKEAVANEQQ
ncbi:MAG: MotA/TolQ/ExbB proton channel family protein [Gudongella sp.]|nr:MotA/TolQ/ExbB proton channel family protein [Gudongella sp.]